MLVAIPSRGRAGKVSSLKYIKGTLYVPAGEREAYARHYETVEAVPMEINNITKTRNWILDHTDDEWIVFCDDDAVCVGWIEFFEDYSKHRVIKSEVLELEFQKLCEIADDMHLPVWGVASLSAPRSTYPYRPFIFHTYVVGSCMGISRKSGLRFDESFVVKEDYELALRVIKEFGGVLGVRYLYWQNEHWTTPGGCKDYRTVQIEEDAIGRLTKMYPGHIRRITRGGSNYSIEIEF